MTCLNAARPRDRSHYERFAAYHASFYREVEATSVTPFSGPALDRGLAGTRHALRDTTWLPRPSAITVTICPPITPQAAASNWQEIVRIRDAARAEIARLAGEPLL